MVVKRRLGFTKNGWKVEGKPTYGVYSKTTPVGDICWEADWKCWAFNPFDSHRYSSGCLKEITDFISSKMKDKICEERT